MLSINYYWIDHTGNREWLPEFYPNINEDENNFNNEEDAINWLKRQKELEVFKTLSRDTQNILIDNRPTFELYPEIYNHSSFDKQGFIGNSWWLYYNNNEMLWETALEQRIKYLNLLVEKLRAE